MATASAATRTVVMRGTAFAALALICSGCLEPRSCLELYTCPPDGDTREETSDAGKGSDAAGDGTGETTESATFARHDDAGVVEAGVTESTATQSSEASSLSANDASSSASSVTYENGPDASDAGPIDLSSSAEPPLVTQVVAGGSHTCALLNNGKVRCWGDGTYGQLGYGNTNSIGDDEVPASAGDVTVGGTVVSLSAGGAHTCALLDNGKVRCWGDGSSGQLGYGKTDSIGDDEPPASAGDVDVGGTVVSLSAGAAHTCALLDTGSVRCWGSGLYGRLGYGDTKSIGDDEAPASAGDVQVGGTVVSVAAGGTHTCALLDTGNVRCWGDGISGRLGYGNIDSIGDDETPETAGDVNVGDTVTQVSAGGSHTCVLLDSLDVRCWGASGYGQLGSGDGEAIGDDEVPASVGEVDVGESVSSVSAATGDHVCAVLNQGNVRCWGRGEEGQLGYANHQHVGDDEAPSTAGDVNVGGRVVSVSAGSYHTCALLDTGAVRCWGAGGAGALGYGSTNSVGREDNPANAGDVVVVW